MIHPREKPYVVILAGGGGTRLWPRSRKNIPKQFLNLFSKKTLLQETYSRIAPLTDNDRIFIVAGEKYKEEILNEIPDLSIENLILEPEPKNTAAAVGLASLIISHRDPNAVFSSLHSDHYIVEIEEFQRVLVTVSVYAQDHDDIVTWGISPTRPATELGYIHSGDEIEEINGLSLFKVKGFKEKPNLVTAQAYVASGTYFWNGGQYSQKVSVMLDSIKKHMPKLWEGLSKIEKVIGTPEYDKVLREVFAELDSEPIDTGISEKAKNLVMIPASYTWSDIGSWDALYEISPKNEGTNTVLIDKGEFIGYDTHRSLIQTNNKLIATIGVTDMIIVDTEDVLLICPKDRAQEVKKIVEQLKEKDMKDYL